MPKRDIPLLSVLFAVSSFTGLIYESVWSHYLKLLLGAADFAQAFVLAAFMGGAYAMLARSESISAISRAKTLGARARRFLRSASLLI